MSERTSDIKSVVSITKGIEKINFPIIPLMKSMAANIHAVVIVVDISGHLRSRRERSIACLAVNLLDL